MIEVDNKSGIFLSFGVLVLLILIPIVAAQIEYPVSELGNCASREECEVYCDNPENAETCLNFAEENDLMSADEIEEARKMIQFLNSGETPGGCRNKEECEVYCDNEEHIEECVTFAERTGLISKEEADMVRRTGGKGPGGCTGEEECEEYCSKDENFEECIDFAREYGLMSEEEMEMSRKTGGRGPGGCRGEEECDAYCNQEGHFEECIDFALEHGLMSEEEAERAKNMGRSGPGGCRSEDECNVYCESHGLECFKFAREHGLIDESQFSEEQLCMINCLVENDVDPSSCEEGKREQSPACMTCAERCIEMPEPPE
jgi:hypothetical protein